ncbi:glycine cleavage system protein GcvH [Streptomyces sp. R-07]|uniref:glycine cleavage system protein GcvH n=1 Tax=unclassified Streptomyces TaxID=2593676 RepID=UPI003426D07D
MSYYPENLQYTKDHEWVEASGGDRARVGLTEFAQKQLGDIVFVDVPTVDRDVEAGDPLGTVESVKSVSEIFAPVSGRVTARNDALEADPELVNTDPYDDGWIVEIQLAGATLPDGLLSAAQYAQYVAAESE